MGKWGWGSASTHYRKDEGKRESGSHSRGPGPWALVCAPVAPVIDVVHPARPMDLHLLVVYVLLDLVYIEVYIYFDSSFVVEYEPATHRVPRTREYRECACRMDIYRPST